MDKSRKKAYLLVATVLVCCCVMAIIETVIEPAYFVKSALKAVFFLFVPIVVIKAIKEKVFADSFSIDKNSVLKLFGLGLIIYIIIMAAFLLTKGFFDYSLLVQSLSADQNVSYKSFVPVALYISFGNSFLEEFLFRMVAFIKLSEHVTKKVAYIFSSCMFAIYHVAMIGGSFPLALLLLALAGLAAGGAIFNYVDEKAGNIYNSWIIHMFADFAIMTIWYIYI